MADPQPGEHVPAAGLPTAASPGAAGPAEPTRVERSGDDGADTSTVDAPVRWSGSAAVPPPSPKRAWWSRRETPAAPAPRPASEPDPTTVDPQDWSAMPAVDPWADQDTPWDLVAPVPEPTPLPPTRVDAPSTAAPAPPRPPATAPTPATPPAAALPPAVLPPAVLPPAALPPAAPAPRRRGWGGRGGRKQDPVPVNRVPVAPRPPATRPPAIRPPAQGRPLPPAPSARRAPARPLPPPPRRRRRWPRNLAVVTLLSAVCCCGIPAYFAWPAARQYPVTAILPDSVADLNRRDDSASRRAAERLTQQLRDTDASVHDVFAGVYSDGDGKRVTVFGTTGLRLTPEADINSELQHLSSQYDIRDVQPFDLGEAGAHERCGVGDTSGTSVVVCAWADHGSLATVLLTRRSVADSAQLTGILRSAVLTRG
jgi:hypothetical protein